MKALRIAAGAAFTLAMLASPALANHEIIRVHVYLEDAYSHSAEFIGESIDPAAVVPTEPGCYQLIVTRETHEPPATLALGLDASFPNPIEFYTACVGIPAWVGPPASEPEPTEEPVAAPAPEAPVVPMLPDTAVSNAGAESCGPVIPNWPVGIAAGLLYLALFFAIVAIWPRKRR